MPIKISDMTPDASIGGSELIPVSDAGAAKSITPSGISGYVVDQIEAIEAGESVSGTTSLYMLDGGDLKPVDIDVVAQHVIDTVWGKAAEASPDSADVMALKDGETEKTVTLASLAEYVRATIEAAVLNLADLSAAATLAADHTYLVTQDGVGKKVAHSTVQAAILSGLEDYVSAKTAAESVSGTDTMYLVQGGVDKKTTVSLISAAILAGFEAYTTALDAVAASATTDVFYVVQGGAEKKATLAQVSTAILSALDTYVGAVDAVETPTDDDVFYSLQSGTEKKVTLSQLSTAILGDLTAHVTATDAAVTANDADTLYLVQGGTGKKLAFSVLVSSIYDGMAAHVTGLDEVTPVSTDELLLVRSGAEKNAPLSAITTAIFDGLNAHVTGKDAVTVTADADVFYCIQGGTAKKVTLEDIVAHSGSPVTGSGTADYLAKWSNASALEAGPQIVTSTDTFPTGSDASIPTAKAVDGRIDALGGYETLWVPASTITPTTTNGADTETHEYPTNDLNHEVLLYAGATADEHAEFNLVMPESWNLGTIKAKVYWAPGHADANADEYVEFYLAAGAFSNDDALDAALGTAVDMADQVIADDDLHITPASGAITVGGTPAKGDMIHFKLSRDYDHDGGGTAMDVDARVFGVLIQYRTNQTVSAW